MDMLLLLQDILIEKYFLIYHHIVLQVEIVVEWLEQDVIENYISVDLMSYL